MLRPGLSPGQTTLVVLYCFIAVNGTIMQPPNKKASNERKWALTHREYPPILTIAIPPPLVIRFTMKLEKEEARAKTPRC